ncbi:MAG: hypothetical protein HY928_08430 [Elusimicrobia bacterium]|nr:hypothetical protein [Elusimicrobiota bacterium]
MRKILALLAVVAVSVQPAAASTTRLLSLGLDNWQLDDEVNHWTNPALLRSAPDFGLFEMGTQAADGGVLTAGSQWGGFHKSLGDSAVFALYIRRPYTTNDFSATGTPLTTPMPGGLISANSVIGTTGLDAAINTAAQFRTTGPFGSTGGSALAITGAPATVARNIALPQNYADMIFAWAWGRMDWGMHFNYARNAGGETRRQYYHNTAGATPGTLEVERLSQEFNTRLGWRWNGWRNTWMHMVLDASLPDFDMDSAESRPGGAFSDSYIHSEPMVATGGLFQFGHRNESESLWSLTLRGMIQDATLVASLREDNTPGGALDFNRRAYMANVRKFGAADFTWVRPFDKHRTLLLSSIGGQYSYTKATYHLEDALASGNNHADMARSSSLLFPVRVAIETQPWDILAVRAGIQKNIFSEARTRLHDGDSTTALTISETDTAITDPNGTADGVGLSFGVGIKLVDGLFWDSVVRQRLLFDGPEVVGGNSVGFFAQTTLVYRWGEEDAMKRVSKLKPMLNIKRLFSKKTAD